MPVERLPPRTVAGSALEAIRNAILDGTLSPGERIREAAIAEELGISRMPVREALQRLEVEGVIVRTPYRGSVVAEISAHLALDIIVVRRLLEPLVQGLAFDRLTSKRQISWLDGAIDDMQAAFADNNVVGAIDLHLDIHHQIYRLSYNQVLTDLWDSCARALRLYFATRQDRFGDTDLILPYKRWRRELAREDAEQADVRLVAILDLIAAV